MMRQRLLGFAVTAVAAMVGVVLVVIVAAVLSRSPGHDDLYDQDQAILDQLTYISCLLLIPPDDRIPENVAACQTE